jgi:hypothetical protein
MPNTLLLSVFVSCFFYWFVNFFANWDFSQFFSIRISKISPGGILNNRKREIGGAMAGGGRAAPRLRSTYGRVARPKPTSYEVFPWETAYNSKRSAQRTQLSQLTNWQLKLRPFPHFFVLNTGPERYSMFIKTGFIMKARLSTPMTAPCSSYVDDERQVWTNNLPPNQSTAAATYTLASSLLRRTNPRDCILVHTSTYYNYIHIDL